MTILTLLFLAAIGSSPTPDTNTAPFDPNGPTVVINYNLEKQMLIARTVMKGLKEPSLRLPIQKRQFLIPLIIISMAVFAVFTIKALLMNRKTEEMKILSRFLRSMEQAGYKKTGSQGLEEFVSFIDDKELKTIAYHFVTDFEKIFYKDKKLDKKDIINLKSIIKNIEQHEPNTFV